MNLVMNQLHYVERQLVQLGKLSATSDLYYLMEDLDCDPLLKRYIIWEYRVNYESRLTELISKIKKLKISRRNRNNFFVNAFTMQILLPIIREIESRFSAEFDWLYAIALKSGKPVEEELQHLFYCVLQHQE